MDLRSLPLDDPKTFALLSRAETLGVFQVEADGMRKLLQRVRPQDIYDIAAVLALYRPGPMGSNAHIEYAGRRGSSRGPEIHPELDEAIEPVLRETFGVLVYQEQVMQILNVVAGWSYAEAEGALKAMGKKQKEKLELLKPKLYREAAERGFGTAALDALWERLLPFTDYAFNKAHAVGYAYLTYRGAYLKANHPEAYMTALLSSSKDADEAAKYVAETRRMKIPILGPDINQSGPGFTKTKEGIRYGLRAIKGVGDSAAELVLAGRPYSTIDNFFRNADPKVLNAGVFSALVKSGAFDSLWSSRTELLEQGPEIGAVALEHRKAQRRGQRTILNTRYRPQKTPGQAQEDSGLRRALEQDVLGTYLTFPRVVLRLSRPLSPVEWKHIKDVLGYENPTCEVYAELGKTRFRLPVLSEANSRLEKAMRIVEVRVESE